MGWADGSSKEPCSWGTGPALSSAKGHVHQSRQDFPGETGQQEQLEQAKTPALSPEVQLIQPEKPPSEPWPRLSENFQHLLSVLTRDLPLP